MGACGAAHSACQTRRQPASCRAARGCQRPDVYPEHRLSVAYPSGVGRSAACLLNVPVLGLHGVEDTVGSERFDRIDEIEAAMEAEPFSGVAMPLDVEAVGADPVEASEGRVELLAEIFREAGAVALDEAILGAMPFAEDIDGIVELRRPD